MRKCTCCLLMCLDAAHVQTSADVVFCTRLCRSMWSQVINLSAVYVRGFWELQSVHFQRGFVQPVQHVAHVTRIRVQSIAHVWKVLGWGVLGQRRVMRR
jgi:hypothetical protein